jgi:hypothetical protein
MDIVYPLITAALIATIVALIAGCAALERRK